MKIITLSGTNLVQEIDDIKRAINSEKDVVFLYNGEERLYDYIDSLYGGIGSKRLDNKDLYRFRVCYEKTNLNLTCLIAGKDNRDIHSMGELLAVLGERNETNTRYRIVVQNSERKDLAFIVQQLIYIEFPLEKIDILLKREERNSEKTRRFMDKAEQLREKARSTVTELECLRDEVEREPESELKLEKLDDIRTALEVSQEILMQLDAACNVELKLAVVASKKTGKSMIVNDFLGNEYAPTSQLLATPCNCIYRKSQDGRFSLQFEGKEKEYFEDSSALHEKIGSYFKDAQNDKGHDYTLADMNIEYVSDEDNFSTYTIWDTAGPDLAGTKHKVAADRAMEECNVAIFAIDYTKYLTDSEVEYLSKIKKVFKDKQKFYSLIFVLNKIDNRYNDCNCSNSVIQAVEFIRKRLSEIDEEFSDCIIIPTSALEFYYAKSVEKDGSNAFGKLREMISIRELEDLHDELNELNDKPVSFDKLGWLCGHSGHLKRKHGIKEVSFDIWMKDSGMPVLMRYASYIAQNQARDEFVNGICSQLDEQNNRINRLFNKIHNIRESIKQDDEVINNIRNILLEFEEKCKELAEKIKFDEIDYEGRFPLLKQFSGDVYRAMYYQKDSLYHEYNINYINDMIYGITINKLWNDIRNIRNADAIQIGGLINNLNFNKTIEDLLVDIQSKLANNAQKQLEMFRDELLRLLDVKRSRLREICYQYQDRLNHENDIDLKFPNFDGFGDWIPLNFKHFEMRVSVLRVDEFDALKSFFKKDFTLGNIAKSLFSIFNNSYDRDIKRTFDSSTNRFKFEQRCNESLREQLIDILDENKVAKNIQEHVINQVVNEYMKTNLDQMKHLFEDTSASYLRSCRSVMSDLDGSGRYRENIEALRGREAVIQRIEKATHDYMSIWHDIVQDETSCGQE